MASFSFNDIWKFKRIDKGTAVLCYVSDYKVKNMKYKQLIIDGFKMAYQSYYGRIGNKYYSDYLSNFITDDNISFYGLKELDNNDFEYLVDILIKYISSDYLLSECAKKLDITHNTYFLSQLASRLVDLIYLSGEFIDYISLSYEQDMCEYELERATKKLCLDKMINADTGDYLVNDCIKTFEDVKDYLEKQIDDLYIRSDIDNFLQNENNTMCGSTIETKPNTYSDEVIMDIFAGLVSYKRQ